jgi:NAD-reducing hydrogenase small subunit
MDRLKFATAWLGGCSGCHMSFLDLDEWLFDLAGKVEVVYSPVVDHKEFPAGVDVTLVEGAVANTDNLEMIRLIRQRTKLLVAFGDCAITGNVTAMRNPLGKVDHVLRRAYLETADVNAMLPAEEGVVPPLLPRVCPVHEVVPVDLYLPGCPPPAPQIRACLEQVLAGKLRPAQVA